MSEPDHLHVKPMPLLANKERAAAFPFSYVTPNDAKYRGIVRRFNAAWRPPRGFRPHRQLPGDDLGGPVARGGSGVARPGGSHEEGRGGERGVRVGGGDVGVFHRVRASRVRGTTCIRR